MRRAERRQQSLRLDPCSRRAHGSIARRPGRVAQRRRLGARPRPGFSPPPPPPPPPLRPRPRSSHDRWRAARLPPPSPPPFTRRLDGDERSGTGITRRLGRACVRRTRARQLRPRAAGSSGAYFWDAPSSWDSTPGSGHRARRSGKMLFERRQGNCSVRRGVVDHLQEGGRRGRRCVGVDSGATKLIPDARQIARRISRHRRRRAGATSCIKSSTCQGRQRAAEANEAIGRRPGYQDRTERQ